MYLSRLILDARQRDVRRDLGDVHRLHRTILQAFPQAPDPQRAREHFGLLYRIEPLPTAPHLVRLLVQSNSVPNWNTLPGGYLGPAPDARGNPAIRTVGAEYERIAAGDRLIFRLRANPTKKLSDRTPGRADRLAGKRVALLREAEQLAWLERKGEQHGFRVLRTAVAPEVPAVQVAVQATERGRRPARDGGEAMALRFGAVLFNGRLEVTDAARFHQTLTAGIGSGKAFGFGLLSIAMEG